MNKKNNMKGYGKKASSYKMAGGLKGSKSAKYVGVMKKGKK